MPLVPQQVEAAPALPASPATDGVHGASDSLRTASLTAQARTMGSPDWTGHLFSLKVGLHSPQSCWSQHPDYVFYCSFTTEHPSWAVSWLAHSPKSPLPNSLECALASHCQSFFCHPLYSSMQARGFPGRASSLVPGTMATQK